MEQKFEHACDALVGGNVLNVTVNTSRHDHSRHHLGDNIFTINHHNNTPDSRLRPSKHPQDRLEEWVSKGAAHDSVERGTDTPKCYPETRAAVQGEILSHVDLGGEEPMLWLSGPAGAGKTAIMGSICDHCYARGWLAGSFFFSTSANAVDRSSKRYLIPTLAYHLFQLNIPGLPAAILASIDAHPSVFDKRLDQQVEILLLDPLREVIQKVDPSSWSKVVVVDGVDECAADEGRTYATEDDRRRSRDENQREVLSALTHASNDPAFPFRILIATRPERAIERYFASLASGDFKKVFLDAKYTPEADIELYARAMLTNIGLDFGLGDGWFTRVGQSRGVNDVPKYLAKESSGQFVYPAAMIRFIQGSAETPQKQLERALNWRGSDASKPFASLDALYAGIMGTSPSPSQAALFIVTTHFVPGDGKYIQTFLQSSPGEVEQLLGPLSSLVRIVDSNGEPGTRLYHKSLYDFLTDPGRSGALYVGEGQVRNFIHERSYDILKHRAPAVLGACPSSVQTAKETFISRFCYVLPEDLPLDGKYQYDADDVGWWLARLGSDDDRAILAYFVVHQRCLWYCCRPACKVWRSGILCYAKENGWRVPTVAEELKDRVKPYPRPRTFPPGEVQGVSIESILNTVQSKSSQRK